MNTTEIPYGYCHCGCGCKTKVSRYTDTHLGWVKGEPRRYLHNHWQNKPSYQEPNPSGLCMCGCGQLAPIATQSNPKYGQIAGKPMRYIHNHHARIPAERRFWTKVDIRGPNECWEWTANKYTNGYGCFFAERGKSIPAHRYAFILTNGPVANDINICHSCDNRPCCNPAHLWSGTQAENMRDMVAKGRGHKAKKK